MDENGILRDLLERNRQTRQAGNLGNIEGAIPRAAQIMVRNPKIDNSREGAIMYLEGGRVSIYQKDNLYFLGYTNLDSPLFEPARDLYTLLEVYQELNSDQ